MNFIKELKNLELTNKDSYIKLRENLEKEKDILGKKIFALKFMQFANEVSEALNIGKPKLDENWIFQICYYYRSFSCEHMLSFRIKDNKDNYISNNEIIDTLDKIANTYTQYNNSSLITKESLDNYYVNENICQEDWRNLDLSKDIADQILDIFLSSEIKKSLEHSQMQVELSNNEQKYKKVKI
jgi:hypothetical protein